MDHWVIIDQVMVNRVIDFGVIIDQVIVNRVVDFWVIIDPVIVNRVIDFWVIDYRVIIYQVMVNRVIDYRVIDYWVVINRVIFNRVIHCWLVVYRAIRDRMTVDRAIGDWAEALRGSRGDRFPPRLCRGRRPRGGWARGDAEVFADPVLAGLFPPLAVPSLESRARRFASVCDAGQQPRA